MNYTSLFSPHNLALLNDWMMQTGELYAEIYQPHSGGSGTPYFIRSLHDLKSLVAQQTGPEIGVTIFRQIQYPLRGVADSVLLEKAIQRIPDGEWYSIVSLEDYFPSACVFWGNGNSHTELQADFSDIFGRRVGIGQNPFDRYEREWFHSHPDEVFLLSVTKNQNYYAAFAEHPEQYQSLVDFWNERA